MDNQAQSVLVYTDLQLDKQLEDKEFRDQFFRAEREIDIPLQFKGLRKFRGMTQGELAEKVGTKQSAISRIERANDAKWELETLVKMAEALGARLSVLIEPYEDVVARYRAEAKRQSVSAATNTTEAGQYPTQESARTATSSDSQRKSKEHGIGSDRKQPGRLPYTDDAPQRPTLSA